MIVGIVSSNSFRPVDRQEVSKHDNIEWLSPTVGVSPICSRQKI